MCNDGSSKALLYSAIALLGVAVSLLVAAAVANGSFFGAFASPGLLIAASVIAGVALGLLIACKSAVQSYYTCMSKQGTITGCGGQLSNFMNNLNAVITVLGIYIVAMLSTAAFAWIPWAAQPAIWVIFAAVLMQFVLVISLVAFWTSLQNCLQGLHR